MMYARRKGEHGSAILESFLSMILLGMILFGILQLFQLALADMIAEYSAFRGARSAAVGFADELAVREALIKSVPASGPMVSPEWDNYSLNLEKDLLKDYMSGERIVEYANWVGDDRYHMDYHCPRYGEPLIGGCCICCAQCRAHYVDTSVEGFGETSRFRFEFVHYPLDLPLHDWLTGRDRIDISGEAELTNHSSVFLE